MGAELRIEIAGDASGVVMGVVHARSCSYGPSPAALSAATDAAIARASERDDDERLRLAVRDMLRYGRYKPTGRGKPASEYLLGAAREGRFPRIAGLVDLNNVVSLGALLPMSIVDVARARTSAFRVRRGREGEQYVFNATGQEIDLRDLLVVATLPDDTPCANPVKDSVRTKVAEDTTEVAAFVYGPAALREVVAEATERFADGVARWCGATGVWRGVVEGS